MLIQQAKPHYDIVVIGAGMVGAGFALSLLRKLPGNPISILVIEAAGPGADSTTSSPSFDDRSTALSYGSSKILQRAGIWTNLAGHVTPIKNIHVSDRGHFGTARLDCQDQGVAALGYVVENRCLGQVLNDALVQLDNIEFLCPALVQSISPQVSGMRLQIGLESSEQVSIDADLVVLADGGRSPICNQLGISIDRDSYGQRAIICNIAFDQPHRNIAYERFTETGPLAVLPLADLDGENRGALVWTIGEAEATLLMSLTDQEILPLLQQRFGYRLGRITRMGERFCYPLSLDVAREQLRPGLVLLGNVAHTLHPVAGQGFNLALRDAEMLAEKLAAAREKGQVLGSMAVLQDFLQQQSKDQNRTIGFTHYMTRLFSNNHQPLVWARKFGLASIDIVPGLKQSFARAAMGLADK